MGACVLLAAAINRPISLNILRWAYIRDKLADRRSRCVERDVTIYRNILGTSLILAAVAMLYGGNVLFGGE